MGAIFAPLTRFRNHADLVGATASAVCIAHCVLTPVAFGLFPQIVRYLPGETWFHRLLAVVIVSLGGVAFIPGYRLHKRRSLLALIGAGMACILTVAWTGENMPEVAEFCLSITGSMLLVTAHLMNRSFCRQCRTCSAEPTGCASTHLH